MKPTGQPRIFIARTFITMCDSQPRAEAVAVRDGRIEAVGTLESVRQLFGPEVIVDETLKDFVVMAGLIDQHLHPLLGATTLTTEVIAPEDWVLPSRTFLAARSAADYDTRLARVVASTPPEEWVFSWGFHALWHGAMDRARLDRIAPDRPVAIWQRSVHDWYLNTRALEMIGATRSALSGDTPAHAQIDFERGHFWENGWMVVLAPLLMPHFMTSERLRTGLEQLVPYLHMNGVTAINEPGIVWQVEPWNLYQEILGRDETPFLSTFIIDGRFQALRQLGERESLMDASEQVARGIGTKVSVVDKQVKLFADGAIVSQHMQMKEPYVDSNGNPDPGHHGEWMMEPEELRRVFDIYWDAQWQIHIHVNGDLGLEVLVDIIEDAQRRRPRQDHRTVIVHFATSTEDLIDRIRAVGAIVSANPYYPVGFADKYSKFGLGPERADVMVRARSVLDRSIPLSYHSDLPICQSNPLAMASWGVTRLTESGRVAGPDQRISVHEALRAVTIESAHSWRREHDLGSIEVGKWANFTVLDSDPYDRDPVDWPTIAVLGTVFEGSWHPVAPELISRRQDGFATRRMIDNRSTDDGSPSCGCDVAELLTRYVASDPRAA
ncbi:MAG: amidohydrolase [Acidimicrobiaceae bacterium]|nr:amidohydrolase [Acidimicrobiaceae bacterium]